MSETVVMRGGPLHEQVCEIEDEASEAGVVLHQFWWADEEYIALYEHKGEIVEGLRVFESPSGE